VNLLHVLGDHVQGQRSVRPSAGMLACLLSQEVTVHGCIAWLYCVPGREAAACTSSVAVGGACPGAVLLLCGWSTPRLQRCVSVPLEPAGGASGCVRASSVAGAVLAQSCCSLHQVAGVETRPASEQPGCCWPEAHAWWCGGRPCRARRYSHGPSHHTRSTVTFAVEAARRAGAGVECTRGGEGAWRPSARRMLPAALVLRSGYPRLWLLQLCDRSTGLH
jgi:hypothetical protein